MKKVFISDFNHFDVPTGGAELVDKIIIEKFDCSFIHSNKVKSFNQEDLYIFSNISLLPNYLLQQIPSLNYIMIEHDYKICQSRHPWRYENNIVPKNHRINYDLYKNAKVVIVQTSDHMEVFKKNDVDANFLNLSCSIWDNEDLDILTEIYDKTSEKNEKYAVYYSINWIKNTQGNLKYCSDNTIPFYILKPDERKKFLENMAKCKGLVFFPIARETFCRLVVEAKCLGLDVITSKNYGASLEDWFDEMNGKDLISFLRNKTGENLTKIANILR